jgi:hypothetical protein
MFRSPLPLMANPISMVGQMIGHEWKRERQTVMPMLRVVWQERQEEILHRFAEIDSVEG